MTLKKEILIIGGGFAGLSAGVELVSQGHHVTLIERRGHLGGRAYSFRDPATGSTLDNGQHILMGCYKETIAFLDKIGTLKLVDFQKNLLVDFAGPGLGTKKFRAWPLPAPWHLLTGFLSFGGLSLKDKISVMRLASAMKKLEKEGDAGLKRLDKKNISQWLNELGQSQKTQNRFWNILNLAALNDTPEVSSAALFSAVLKEAFFSGKAGSRIGIPKVGLSDLYTEAARDYIERKGGNFITKSRVVRLHFKGREFQEAELEGGARISAEYLLSTVPFRALKMLLNDQMLYEEPFFLNLGRLTSSPIVAVHLWFDREITQSPFVGFWGTRVHWLFNKARYHIDKAPYLSLVISGAREELAIPGPELIKIAMSELGSIYPEVGRAKLLHSMVSKEPEATLSPAVGVSAFRLPQKTPFHNFFLAGDWTDTGLPATIESAVRSAKKAVELIALAS